MWNYYSLPLKIRVHFLFVLSQIKSPISNIGYIIVEYAKINLLL